MALELRISQSVIGGLMFRGTVNIPTADGYHLGFSYKGKHTESGAPIFKMSTHAITPSETENKEVPIEFDFHIFNYWVDSVEVILPNGEQKTFPVVHLK